MKARIPKPFIVSIGEKTYQMGKITLDSIIKIATDKYKGQYAILCVIKGNIAEMKKDTFESKATLDLAISEYKKQGFEVSFTSKEECSCRKNQ